MVRARGFEEEVWKKGWHSLRWPLVEDPGELVAQGHLPAPPPSARPLTQTFVFSSGRVMFGLFLRGGLLRSPWLRRCS